MLSSENITQLATEIVNQTIQENWYVFALIALFTLASTALATFLYSYLTTRGKNYATKTDFDVLLTQLEKTTVTTESIKSAISGKQLKELEINAMYREKIEALFSETFALNAWMENSMAAAITDGTAKVHDSPMAKIEMYQALYFKDVASEFNAMEHAHSEFLTVISRMLSEKENLDAILRDDYPQVSSAVFSSVTEFRENLLRKYSNRFEI